MENKELLNDLELKFDEVKEICINVDGEQDRRAVKGIDRSMNNPFRNEEYKEVRFKLIEEQLNEYKNEGWNIDYAQDTISAYISSEGIDIYCFIVR